MGLRDSDTIGRLLRGCKYEVCLTGSYGGMAPVHPKCLELGQVRQGRCIHSGLFSLSVCSLLPHRYPAAKAECVQLSVLKWQVSRISDIFHDFKDISALLPCHILKLMMTALRVA